MRHAEMGSLVGYQDRFSLHVLGRVFVRVWDGMRSGLRITGFGDDWLGPTYLQFHYIYILVKLEIGATPNPDKKHQTEPLFSLKRRFLNLFKRL